MHAKITDLKKLLLALGAVLSLAAPIHAQTLQASVSQVTIGAVMNCNDTQVVTLTTSSGALTVTASMQYAASDKYSGWANLQNQSTGASGQSVNLTIPSGGSVNLAVALNTQLGFDDSASLVITSGRTTLLTIPVNEVYTLACAPLTNNNGTLTAIPAGLSLTAALGESVTQDVIISNISANTVTVGVGPSPSFAWLTANYGTYTLLPGQSLSLAVTANSAGLQVGTYAGALGITWGITNPVLYVDVIFTVTANGVGPGVTTGVRSTSNAVNFNYVPGANTIPGQSVMITNQVGTQPIPFSVSVTQYNGPANWLSTNWTSAAATPFQLLISANNQNLVPGITYQGSITITPYLGPAVEIYVSLAVAAAPMVSASPASLTFNAIQGGPAPAAQTVVVTGGGADISYSTVAIIPGWLSAYPPTGGAPSGTSYGGVAPGGGAYLYISVNPSGLQAGTYTGTVTVYGSGPAVGETNIAVTLIVSGPTVKALASSASFNTTGGIAPGEMVTLFADPSGAIGPAAGVPLTADLIQNGMLPTTLGGVQVFFNGVAAPMIYASATQLNAVAPYEIAGASNVNVTVNYGGLTTAAMAFPVVTSNPALFTATATGVGQGAIGQYDSQGNYRGMNSPENPVTRGNVITLYLTGEGKTQTGVTGQITTAQSTAPYTPQPMVAPAVLIDGQPATVLFYGEVPGVVAGMMQINAVVPPSAHTGPITVSVSMGTSYSQAGVVLYAQ